MFERKKITPPDLKLKKEQKEKITMLTAYDYPIAALLDEIGIDTILVGDSLGMVVLGYENTVPVTMDEMIHHCCAVKRGIKHALLIGDMPFMSYQVSTENAIRNAGRFLKEGGCDAVKLEGGLEMIDTIKAIVRIGIPVVGHIGLTPQTATSLGGFKVQGKDLSSAQYLLDSAIALEDAGISLIVLECIPDELANLITGKISVPTIGIGAGPNCDGQVLVTNDLLGLFKKFIPTFVKQYAQLYPIMEDAIKSFSREVKSGEFPADKHSFKMDKDTLAQLKVSS